MALGAYSQETRKTILFNDNWKFHKGEALNAEKPVFDDSKWRQLDLPHDWSIEGPFDSKWASGTGFLPGGIGWYRKVFTLPADLDSKNVFIYFDGVYNNSEVWINGHYLGKRPNGFVSFQYDISKYLSKGGKNTISVKADHTNFADSRWYTGSGIYRNVYLIAKDPVHIDLWGVKFSTPQVSEASAMAKVNVSIVNKLSKATRVRVTAKLVSQQGNATPGFATDVNIEPQSKGDASINFNVANPALWSVENPELYTLDVSLHVDGKKVDELKDQVGFRSYRFDKDKGFSLNGKSMKLKGVCIHDDAGALGVAVPGEVWERRLKILKEGGTNAIRLSHNPHADYLYKLMDKMGFLVMDEAFDEWEFAKNKWIEGWNVGTPGKDGYFANFKEWAERDLADMVLRNYNRPSIILWSIGNEVDYPNDPYSHEVLNTGNNPQIYGKGYQPNNPPASRITGIAKQLVEIVKKIDTTRPVTTAFAGVVMSNAVAAPDVMDLAGYNYQEFRYADDHKNYPNRIIYGSENGMSLSAWKAVADNEYISGQFLWTGVDYLGEARKWPSRSNESGLIDLAGFPKTEYYFRKSLWSDEPMVYAGTAPLSANSQRGSGRRNIFPHWNYKAGDSVRVSGFTNQDTVELFINGKSSGKKSKSELKDNGITWDVVYEPGELVLKGYKNAAVSTHILKTSAPAYAIKATADRTSFTKSGKHLAHIEITLTDQNGLPVFDADNEITVQVEGPAVLLGLESGSSISHEDYQANKRKALHGKLLAYLQTQGKAGNVSVRISAPGLKEQVLRFRVD
ncbi:MAG: glycoside hydrolase family 2 protein [Sphingobacteriaceae bacterium]|nr:glycoside hydrolase family 2 protein [Sphingobacteriaceae bacterium]